MENSLLLASLQLQKQREDDDDDEAKERKERRNQQRSQNHGLLHLQPHGHHVQASEERYLWPLP